MLLVASFGLASQLRMELMVAVDEGIVDLEIKTKPGLSIAAVNEAVAEVEQLVAQDEEVDHYLLTYGASGLSMGGSGVALSAYLRMTASFLPTK